MKIDNSQRFEVNCVIFEELEKTAGATNPK